MIRSRMMTSQERALADQRQRDVIQLMHLNSENARLGLTLLDRGCFLDQRFAACFEAFKDVPLPENPTERVDIVIWVRAAHAILERWGVEARVSEFATRVQLEDTPPLSIQTAARHLREFSLTMQLADAGAWLQQAATDPASDPLEAAATMEGIIRGLRQRGDEQAGGMFAAGGTLAQLIARCPEQPPWIVDEVIHQGAMAFLVGQPGIGKTWIALALARAVALGIPFFGLTTHQAPVCTLLLETWDWALVKRVEGFGLGEWTENVYPATPDTLKRSTIDLTNGSDRRALIAWVKGVEAGLVILDPFTYIHSLGENETAEMKQVLVALDEVRHETGAAILVLHHERKGKQDAKSEGSDLDAMRGSSALSGAADAVLRLRTVNGVHCLRFAKVRAGRTPEAVWLEQTDAGTFVETEAPADQHEEKEERVDATRSVLRNATGWLSAGEITTRVQALDHEVSDTTVRRYLKQLKDAGEVRTSGRGKKTRYWWTGSDSDQGKS